jgi:DNA-binding Xre family transcriptional regulator
MGFFKYDKLFLMLRIRDIKINELVKNKVVTAPTMKKLRNNQNVYTDVLIRLCDYLKCDSKDIFEFISDDAQQRGFR